MKDRKLLAALVIPIVGILAFIAFSEARVRAGTRWLIPIAGYDPRDLLSGHYLTFRYDWHALGADSLAWGDECSSGAGTGCHICLEPGDDGEEGGRFAPHASKGMIEKARSCTAWMEGTEAFQRQRFYIPENEAARLESLVRERKAAVVISLSRSGKAQIVELYVDGKPWREATPSTSE